MQKGPGCETILFPVLEKATEYFIYPPNDGIKRDFRLKDHINFLLQQERQREREKMIEEITKKIIDEVDYVQNHSSGNYADGMVDALLKIKRDIIKNKEDSK